MKLLRETIRNLILQEGMITADQLPEGVMIRIKGRRESAKIEYVRSDDRQIQYFPTYPTEEDPHCWGSIKIEKYSWPNNIPVWEVLEARAGQGYGPLLYDIAMEYATENGLGLMSDRVSVSDEAVGVWDYYFQNRVGKDVKAHQMDDMENTLTDTDDDNNNQYISKKLAKANWPDHSTSKRYTKSPTTLEALGDKVIYT
jgi:hypothetical protein